MKIKIDNKKKLTVISDIEDFDLISTLRSGQTFRYYEVDEGAIVINNDVATYFEMKENKLIVDTVDKTIVNMWINYFNLKTDYRKIKEDIIKCDKRMKKIVEYGNGIRIIKQDEWESILTFIISANNNMARIKGLVNEIAKTYGKKICTIKGIDCYSLPAPSKVAKLKEEDLRKLGVGFRDKYIIDAAKKLNNKIIDIEILKKANGKIVKEELIKIKGVGEKVADCVRLFGFNKFDSFPVDVWIERIMIDKFLKNDKMYTKKQIEEYGMKRFKDVAGYAQQYIFYYCITEYKKEIVKVIVK